MRILYHHRTVSRDGQDVHISEMVAALRRRGHEVLVVGPERNAAFGGGGGGVAGLRKLLPRTIGELLELSYSLPAYVRLTKACRSFRPDVLYERYNLFFLAGAWLKARTGIPYLVEVNAPLSHERKHHGGLGLPGLAHWSEAKVWRAADAVLPVTRRLGDFVVGAGVDCKRVHPIPNGVDSRVFHAETKDGGLRQRLGIEGKLVVGFVGFIRPWHGLSNLVDAVAALKTEFPTLHLLIAGDGPSRGELIERARRQGLGDAVTCLGVVPRQDMAATIAAFDIAVQPRVVAYASPLKLFEYMALGKAVIAPDQANIREVLRHRAEALLFSPHDPHGLRRALSVLCREAPLRRRLGMAAALAVLQRGYSWDANAERIERLVLGLTAAREGRITQPLADAAE